MVFDPANNRLYGGGSNAQTKATWYDPATGLPMWLPNGWNACNIIQGPCPSGCPNANGEIRHITLAPNGNFYAYTAVGDGSTSNNVSTITGFDPNFVGIYRSCNVPPSQYWTIPYQPTMPTYYVGCYYMGNGIAASNCYIYIYTGSEVQKFDIYAPTFLGSTNITNGTLVMNSGILADLMNNFYVGTQTGISAYDPNFNLITSVPTSKPVYDMAFAPGNNIAACGIGFVGVFANVVQTGAPITCNPSPNLPMSAAADSLPGTGCSSNNAMAWVDTIMNGTGPYQYSWNNGATTDTIINLAPGTYSCTIIDASCPAETTTVFITIPPSSGFTVTPTSTANLCFGGTNGSASVTITGGSSPYTYLWSPSGGNSSAATGLSAGNYTVTITDAGGCTGTQTVSVSQPTALSAIVSSTAESCGGSNGTATATASGGTGSYTYSWNPTSQITQTASNLPAGNYSITITDANGCTTSNTVVVAATGSLTANASNSTICAGQNASLTASGGTSYSWSNGNTTALINVSPTVTTTYSVIVSSGTCSDTASATVVVNSSPNISAWSNTTITAGSSTTLSASGGSFYSWSNGQTSTVIIVSPPVTTMYCVSSSNGTCTDTACVTVFIEPPDDCNYADDQLFIPDAFSPNGDTKNDVLGVYYPNISCIKEFMFIIYDRWGEKVFEADNMSVLWDGTYNGKIMNTAVFVYYMKVNFTNGNETVRKGNVSLIR
ncbi:MAG: gliding motility-associated C-terminal domain-containing protein [Bacteroidetes bacterium]|nr:gliding motility-associated C-terminal domain-containing protein [Bacteroidota bacterium]